MGKSSESPFSTLVWNDCNPSVLAVQGYHRFESEWKCCVSLKGVTANRVYALRQGKLMMVAVVPQRQADCQTLSGCILPERKPKAVKLLFALLLRREGESNMQPTHHQAADAIMYHARIGNDTYKENAGQKLHDPC